MSRQVEPPVESVYKRCGRGKPYRNFPNGSTLVRRNSYREVTWMVDVPIFPAWSNPRACS